MLDVRLFANMRFTAASGSVTLCYFALFGFIFLITQYSQFILGWGVLEAGVRQIPVALAVAVFSLLGMPVAVRLGTKAVVAFGMAVLGRRLPLDRDRRAATPATARSWVRWSCSASAWA